MSAPGRLRHLVGEAIATHELWGRGHRVAVAVSGGLDSMCLLDLLLETRAWHGGELSVATVDHGTRPGSAPAADLVERRAAELGLACHRFVLGLGSEASELTCRTARYRCLDQLEVDRIAVGHHRDDQAETVLLHLIRGTGLRGLAGMGWRRDRIVRPLLAVSRAHLLRWAEHRGLEWVEDPTNTDARFLRNRLRHEVLPLLEDLRPGAAEALARSAASTRQDADLLDAIARADPGSDPTDGGWSTSWVVSTPAPLVRRALLAAFPGIGSAHLDAVITAAHRGRGAVQLPGWGTLEVGAERLWLVE